MSRDGLRYVEGWSRVSLRTSRRHCLTTSLPFWACGGRGVRSGGGGVRDGGVRSVVCWPRSDPFTWSPEWQGKDDLRSPQLPSGAPPRLLLLLLLLPRRLCLRSAHVAAPAVDTVHAEGEKRRLGLALTRKVKTFQRHFRTTASRPDGSHGLARTLHQTDKQNKIPSERRAMCGFPPPLTLSTACLGGPRPTHTAQNRRAPPHPATACDLRHDTRRRQVVVFVAGQTLSCPFTPNRPAPLVPRAAPPTHGTEASCLPPTPTLPTHINGGLRVLPSPLSPTVHDPPTTPIDHHSATHMLVGVGAPQTHTE
ncbi:hypothetical protein E2C01_052971 [Portunus trituberculatus]|uniref:Uncharacterized protein n=1 Tax=Portunus trituberculatus TaxID=210409 RepID=A0A5B7GN77_PORTR|nr:hypothetical protein [Portunus trituberculatus]